MAQKNRMSLLGLLDNPEFVRSISIVGFITLLFLVSNIFVIGGDEFFKISNTLISPAVALVASFLFYQASTNKEDTVSRPIWINMALGFGLWGAADVLWAFFTLAMQDTVPYPSIADLVWVIGYIPLFIALVLRLRSLQVTPSRRQYLLIIGFNLILIALTVIFVLIPIVSDFDPERLLEGIVNLIYPLADTGLVLLASLILILLRRGRFSLIWRFIFTGVLVMTISDLLFTYGSWQELYYPEDQVNALTILIDTTYTLAYIFAGLGIYIYRYIWEIKEKFKVNSETLPVARLYAFLGTDQNNQVVITSNNFFHLVGGNPQTSYLKKPLHTVLGLPAAEAEALIKRISSQGLLTNEAIAVATQEQQTRRVLLSAIAINIPGLGFVGANMALTADGTFPDQLRLPENPEHQSMMNHVLARAGTRSQDETQTLQVYFLEVIRLFSSLLIQFGGERFRNTLFEQLNQTIQRESLPMKITGQTISFPESPEPRELAPMLITLLGTAMRFTANLIGTDILKNDLEELEKSLRETTLQDLDKFHLRAFHTSA